MKRLEMTMRVLPAGSRKVLARLETRQGILISTGGAQLHPDGSGFFIAALGSELRPVPCEEGVLQTVTGDVIQVFELQIELATSALPGRYTFSHPQGVSIQATRDLPIHA
jgi:hypothetical protein